MPLNAANMVLNGHLVSADIRGFYDLFTGGMTDQPVTFGNNLSIVGITMLSRDPTAPLEAATKQYVDNHGLNWPLLAPHSTPSTPNYAFAPDPTTGMYSPGNGMVSIAVGGADMFRVAATVATITPPFGVLSTLDVQGLTNFYAGINARNGIAVLGGAATGNGTVPPGGLAAQVLTKNTNADYDLVWGAGGGGGTTSIRVFEAQAVTGPSVTLPVAPALNGVISVSVNGQELQGTRDWTIAGSTITFATALSADDVRVEYWTAPFNPGQYAAHYEVTLAPGATSFTLPVAPSGIPLLTRGGVVQYTTQGHYVMAGATVNLGVAVNTTEDGHFSVDYIAGGGTDAATVGGLTPAQLLASRANLLTNGGFDVWQRGGGPFNGVAGTTLTADRWGLFQVGTDVINVQRVSGGTNGWGVMPQVNFTLGSGAGTSSFSQALKLSDGFNFAGRTVTFAISLSVTVANAVRIAIFDRTNNLFTYSPFHVGDGNWRRMSVSQAVNPGCQELDVFILFAATVSSVYIDDATLVVGGQALDYVALHPADELARCRRYCSVYPVSSIFPGQAIGTTQANVLIPILSPQYPTITWTSPTANQLRSAAQGALPVTGTPAGTGLFTPNNSVEVQVTASAGGLIGGNATSLILAGASQVVLEWNP